VDICVANAGGPPAKTFDQAGVPDWRSAVELNFMNTLFFAREVLPLMRERGWGRFLTITSISVKQPLDNLILSNSVRPSRQRAGEEPVTRVWIEQRAGEQHLPGIHGDRKADRDHGYLVVADSAGTRG